MLSSFEDGRLHVAFEGLISVDLYHFVKGQAVKRWHLLENERIISLSILVERSMSEDGLKIIDSSRWQLIFEI